MQWRPPSFIAVVEIMEQHIDEVADAVCIPKAKKTEESTDFVGLSSVTSERIWSDRLERLVQLIWFMEGLGRSGVYSFCPTRCLSGCINPPAPGARLDLSAC
ncbi:hypothetical protein CEXT_560811 [Caerostris extrusa]|uniref:Uncharacterized protein n=1 Tax=Caerostris extrusa TaxID=172846 RepID=A0AAV4XJC1_CAEEX|nr:hypothetical protein CEXT_560811 [Caerostris extrusa]